MIKKEYRIVLEIEGIEHYVDVKETHNLTDAKRVLKEHQECFMKKPTNLNTDKVPKLEVRDLSPWKRVK